MSEDFPLNIGTTRIKACGKTKTAASVAKVTLNSSAALTRLPALGSEWCYSASRKAN